MPTERQWLDRDDFPFDGYFYKEILAKQNDRKLSDKRVVEKGGVGFRVEPGQIFRFELLEGTQVLDVSLMNSDDPFEHYSTGTQMAIEGGVITQFTRVWGTAPLSRPLATCIGDTVQHETSDDLARDHFGHCSHCSVHQWFLLDDRNQTSCYDNLRAGLAERGMGQRYITDNLNLFIKGAIDPETGALIIKESDSKRGDYIEFYAEIPLHCIVSLCPANEENARSSALKPVAISVFDVPETARRE